MKRPSKKEIQAAVDKLKENKPGSPGAGAPGAEESAPSKLEAKKSNKNRIRKQGI